MGILLDTSIHVAAQTAATVTFTTPITIADKPNRILLVVLDGSLVSDKVTGVTWAGQAMTKVTASVQKPSNRWTSYWYLLSPTVGANNLVVTNSSSDYTEPSLACYYNVVQSAPEATASASGAANGGGVTSPTQIIDGQGSYNIVSVNRSDNPIFAPGSKSIQGGGDATVSVTTLTRGSWVVGALGSGGGAWVAYAVSLKPIRTNPSIMFGY